MVTITKYILIGLAVLALLVFLLGLAPFLVFYFVFSGAYGLIRYRLELKYMPVKPVKEDNQMLKNVSSLVISNFFKK